MTTLPSVTGVEVAWLDFGCRLVFGMPSCAVLSQTTLPVALSSAIKLPGVLRGVGDRLDVAVLPVRIPCFGSLPIAVETNTRSPQTIGLETATPSTGVFHATFSLAGTFHLTAVGLPSAVPAALAPRNAGQF